jgi:hypothetical protein
VYSRAMGPTLGELWETYESAIDAAAGASAAVFLCRDRGIEPTAGQLQSEVDTRVILHAARRTYFAALAAR